jgi:hypothetical protein
MKKKKKTSPAHRGVRVPRWPYICRQCYRADMSTRQDTLYCGPTCRQAASRQRRREQAARAAFESAVAKRAAAAKKSVRGTK